MRFCPFCAQENPDDSRECGHCGKRLPALRAAPPRAAAVPPPRPEPPRPVAPRPAPRSRPLSPSPGGDASASSPVEARADSALDVPAAPPPEPARAPASEAARPRRLTPAPPAESAPPVAARPPAGETSRPRRLTPPPPAEPAPAAEASRPRSVTPPPRGRSLTPIEIAPTAPASVDTPPSRPTRSTLLGVPRLDAQKSEAPAARPSGEVDSGRRETRPLQVKTAAAAAGLGAAPTVASSTQSRPVVAPPSRDDGVTEPTPLADESDFGGETHDDFPVGTAGALMQQPRSEASSMTPLMPTLALPPMPAPPPAPTIFSSVRYLYPLARAIWARRAAQRSIRELLHGDQRLLDQVLRDLGRAAREEDLALPAIADEMQRVRTEEDRRAQADDTIQRADADAAAEAEHWKAEEAERQTAIAGRDSELRTSEQELRIKGDEQRVHDTERKRLDAQIGAAERKAQNADTRATKAENMPPEKGGGPNTVANARQEADSARREASAIIPARDQVLAKVQALEEPVTSLAKKIADLRAELAAERKALADALGAHKKLLAELAAGRKRAEGEREAAEREMSQRFVAAGTLLNLNRVEGAAFAPLYARIDELKGGVNAREAAIVRLESERRSYDRDAVQKGLIAVGVVFGILILGGIVLAVLLSR